MSDTESITWSNINPKVRVSIMIGLALGMLLACLDGTIVSTSLPKIVEDLGGMELYSWVFTGFMLCETIMIPISGKLSDLYGRKPIFMAGIVIFMTGSVLSGLSSNMEQLIVFRAIQGLGGGILIPVATAAVADLYPPHQRGKIQGMLGALFAVATCLGPFLGGYITDNISWHWVFYINLPFGILAIIMATRKFPVQEDKPTHRIDYLGMAILSVFLVDLLLFFTWVGVDFEWISMESLIMMGIAALLLALFILREFRAPDPVLQMNLFRGNTFLCCCIIMFVFGLAMMGVMAYLPVFMQVVVGMSASNTGVILLPLVAGMMITSMSSGVLVRKTGYRPWLIAGPIITCIGMYLMSLLTMDSSETTAIMDLFVTGLGLGCVMSVVMIAAQNSAKKGEMGMVTSSVNLFRSIGSTIAVGIFATMINAKINTELAANIVPSELYDTVPHTTGILDWLNANIGTLDISTINSIIMSYGNSIDFAFLVGAVIVLICIVFAILMKNDKVPVELEADVQEQLDRLNSKLLEESGKDN